MTCYDFYFYENYAPLALKNVDVIIGCSHQRSDTHEALSIINKFLCYHTNAYLLRSSVSLGADSKICGCSCIISPFGTEIVNLKSEIGIGVELFYCPEYESFKNLTPEQFVQQVLVEKKSLITSI